MQNTKIVKLIALGILICGIVFWITSYYVREQQKEIVSNITLKIVEQEKTLTAISEITDRNGADAVVESIILDCSLDKRNRFDVLLNNLGNLNSSELQETSSLFDACARFFAERKAVMVSRMSREFEVYSNLVDLLKIVDSSADTTVYKMRQWGELVELEKKRSSIFDSQAVVQYDIIKALQNGEKVGSKSITEMLTDAKNINEEAAVLNQQIDALRGTILDI